MEFQKEFILSNEAVDEVSEQVASFLESLNTERKNLLQIKLLVEDLLLDWQEFYSADAPFTLKMGKHMGRPYIQMDIMGVSYNPLNKECEDYGSYRNRLMANMGLAPMYSFMLGRNRLTFKLKKPKMHPLLSLALAIVCGLLVGWIGLMLPDAVRNTILDFALIPIYDTFFNILGTIAGPLVFLSVAWGIYGIGDTATFGRIGKRMIIHFIGMVYSLTTICILFALPVFDLSWAKQGGSVSQLGSIFHMILGFFPTDIVTPFQDGNSLQIIFLGTAMGLALLVLGSQTELVAQAIEQINYILQFLMELISNLVPWFIFIVLVQLMWSGTLDVVVSAWKPMAVLVLLSVLLAAILVLLAALRTGTNPVLLVKKGLPTLIIAMTTASSVASFGSCVSTCEQKLGVRSNITNFGVPLGIVLFPPATAMCFILICVHSAEVYAVEVSATWIVVAIFTGVILAIAAPPIPGGTLTCYTIMFMQLGLPESGLVAALALDVLCDFVATGFNMFCLQMELLIQSRNTGMLNANVLHKE